jgi:hypothetical protein
MLRGVTVEALRALTLQYPDYAVCRAVETALEGGELVPLVVDYLTREDAPAPTPPLAADAVRTIHQQLLAGVN